MAENEAAKAATEQARGRRKTRQGRVSSAKMDKTIVIKVVRRVQHPLYGKTVIKTQKFKAHVDEFMVDGVSTKQINGVKVEEGDTVEIMETRPLSREKNWRVVRVIEKVK